MCKDMGESSKEDFVSKLFPTPAPAGLSLALFSCAHPPSIPGKYRKHNKDSFNCNSFRYLCRWSKVFGVSTIQVASHYLCS